MNLLTIDSAQRHEGGALVRGRSDRHRPRALGRGSPTTRLDGTGSGDVVDVDRRSLRPAPREGPDGCRGDGVLDRSRDVRAGDGGGRAYRIGDRLVGPASHRRGGRSGGRLPGAHRSGARCGNRRGQARLDLEPRSRAPGGPAMDLGAPRPGRLPHDRTRRDRCLGRVPYRPAGARRRRPRRGPAVAGGRRLESRGRREPSGALGRARHPAGDPCDRRRRGSGVRGPGGRGHDLEAHGVVGDHRRGGRARRARAAPGSRRGRHARRSGRLRDGVGSGGGRFRARHGWRG